MRADGITITLFFKCSERKANQVYDKMTDYVTPKVDKATNFEAMNVADISSSTCMRKDGLEVECTIWFENTMNCDKEIEQAVVDAFSSNKYLDTIIFRVFQDEDFCDNFIVAKAMWNRATNKIQHVDLPSNIIETFHACSAFNDASEEILDHMMDNGGILK